MTTVLVTTAVAVCLILMADFAWTYWQSEIDLTGKVTEDEDE